MNNEPVTGDLKTENGFDWVFDGSNWLKIMNNEPVAWMNPDTLECGHGGNVDWEDTGCIPLYTHPVKELTDEEIIAVGNAVVNHIDSNEGWIEFARAILRKATQ
jgi:hypothetical protein